MEIDKIRKAEQILIDNGVEADEASTILQAIGFALLDEDLYKPLYKASNIKWNENDVNLPPEVIVAFEDLNLHFNATDDEVKNALSDYLSDEYGVSHDGFEFSKVDVWRN